MSAKIWVVSRIGWEYDDSRYYKPESEGSYPVAALTLEELANEICKEKNASELRSLGSRGLSDYIDSYDYRVDFDDEENKKFFNSHYLDEELEFIIPMSEISNETLLEVISYFGINFYEVIEVDLLA